MEFRWDDWNLEHVAAHGVEPHEAEWVALTARRPYPTHYGDRKLGVQGPTHEGRLLQVIFLLDEDKRAYVIHARPLTPREKVNWRRRCRR